MASWLVARFPGGEMTGYLQRHNEIRDLEAEMLRMVCTDVEIYRTSPSGNHWGRGK